MNTCIKFFFKYLQSHKHHTSLCHPDDKGSECKTLDHSDIVRIPIMNITDAISSKKGFRAKVNLYTDDKFENIAGVRKLSKRESDDDEYDPWASISPIGNGFYKRKLFDAFLLMCLGTLYRTYNFGLQSKNDCMESYLVQHFPQEIYFVKVDSAQMEIILGVMKFPASHQLLKIQKGT